MTPTPSLPLATYTGNITIEGASGDTIVPFSFVNLSNAIGDLQITTVDEFTYYAAGSPNLAGASVTVTNSLTQQVAATGTTDANGLFDLPNLPEGYYDLHITADQHSSYTATVFVNPGVTNPVTAFLSRQVVTYNFTVLPTQIQDQTQVQVDSTFQTDVPAPVIVVSPAVIDFSNLTFVGQVEQINLTITNYGLIAAQGMTIGVPNHPYYSVTPLITNIGDLPAKSSITIPVIIERIAVPDSKSLVDTTPGAVADPSLLMEGSGSPATTTTSAISPLDGGLIPCTLVIPIDWKLKCGPGDKYYSLEITCLNIQGQCPPGMPVGLPGFPVFTGTPGTIAITPVVSQPVPCNPLVAAVFDCLHDLLPFNTIAKCYSGAIQLVKGNPGGISVPGTILTCATAALEAVEPVFPVAGAIGAAADSLGKAMDEINCIKGIIEAYQQLSSMGSSGGATAQVSSSAVASGGLAGAINQLQTYGDDLQTLVDETIFIFGNSDWINENTGAKFENWMSAFLQVATNPTNIPSPNGMNFVTANQVSPDQAAQLEAMTLPEGVSVADVQLFIARWNNTYTYNAAGIFDSTQLQPGQDPNFIAFDLWAPLVQAEDTAYQQIQAAGFSDFPDAIYHAESQIYSNATLSQAGLAGGVCATVKIQIDQTAVVTRQAFDATLEIDNGDMSPLTNVGLQVIVRDANGNDVTNLFTIQGPTLNGLTDVSGNGMLAMNTNGSATYTLVPNDDAAPSVATTYYVSAVLNYSDNGESLTIPFSATPITVEPNPSLTLRYFMQRDVFGDDPFTPQVEPSEPFALGVQVINSGAGTANNVQITSAQPTIVDNEKGLLVNFQIIGTQVDGQNLNPSLTANFGDIAPGGVSAAVFLLESSIQGQFIDFSASYKDISGLGSPQASIINGIEIHELTHLAQGLSPSDVGKTDFLVDDIPNPLGTPDTIYLADGTSAPVAQATNPSFAGSPGPGNLTIHLTDTPTSGWVYLDIADPGGGNYRLVSVERSDGVFLPANDFYQTDRTFVGGGVRPIYENELHILDDNSTGSYTLIYAPVDTTPPVITSISPVVPNPAGTPVDGLQVTFSKPIDLSTFNYQDLTLTRNGGPNLITSAVTVSLVSGETYEIDGLSTLDAADGSYLLTINDNTISDPVGNLGTGTAQTSWVEAKVGPAVASIIGVIPGPRNLPVPAVVVIFTEPIQPSSFSLSAVSLTLNGGPNLLAGASGVTLVQDNSTTFNIDGLTGLTTADGNYVLTVDASNVLDLGGDMGVGTSVITWTMDTVAPTIVSIAPVPTPRSLPVSSISVTFSKAINPTTFNTTALALSFNGGPNLITPGSVTITPSSGTTFVIGGLDSLTTNGGSYSFTVNSAALTDLAGNKGQGSQSVGFVVQAGVPDAPTGLAITPDTGASSTDGLTDTPSVTLVGLLGSTGLSVDVVDTTSGQDLGLATVNGTGFSLPIAFATMGDHLLSVTAIDGVGHVSSPATFNVFIDTLAPTVSSIGGISPGPRNTPVSSLTVTFSKPLDPATLGNAGLVTLTLNGQVIAPALNLTLVSGSTYTVGGLGALTTTQGSYVLTVNASKASDPAGNIGTNSLMLSWLLDTLAPSSSVSPLSATESSSAFLVTATGTDPSPGSGVTPSGIASFDLYVAVNSGSLTYWTTVPASSPTALYMGQAGHHYYFQSFATDLAGNVETKAAAIEASTFVPFPPPTTTVLSATLDPTTLGQFDLTLQGIDPTGPGLAQFQLYVRIDNRDGNGYGPLQRVAVVVAGTPDANGIYHATATFQAPTDGQARNYEFFSVGVNTVSDVEPQHASPDLTINNQAFSSPTPLQVTHLVVQDGEVERSYVRYVNLVFNQGGAALQALYNAILANPTAYLQLIQHPLSGPGSNDPIVSLSGVTLKLDLVNDVIELDFGVNGLGGLAQGSLSQTAYWNALLKGNGYYEIDLDPTGQDQFSAGSHDFFDRVLGDLTGDGSVDANDLNALLIPLPGQTAADVDTEVAGPGTSASTALFIVKKSAALGQALNKKLHLDG